MIAVQKQNVYRQRHEQPSEGCHGEKQNTEHPWKCERLEAGHFQDPQDIDGRKHAAPRDPDRREAFEGVSEALWGVAGVLRTVCVGLRAAAEGHSCSSPHASEEGQRQAIWYRPKAAATTQTVTFDTKRKIEEKMNSAQCEPGLVFWGFSVEKELSGEV